MTTYFQHFTGEEFFQHEFPHERWDLSHWRKRLGNKLELLLADSLRVAHQSGALRTMDLKRVTVDTTVQPKAITFPTDAKLLHASIKGLNRMPTSTVCGCGSMPKPGQITWRTRSLRGFLKPAWTSINVSGAERISFNRYCI